MSWEPWRRVERCPKIPDKRRSKYVDALREKRDRETDELLVNTLPEPDKEDVDEFIRNLTKKDQNG